MELRKRLKIALVIGIILALFTCPFFETDGIFAKGGEISVSEGENFGDITEKLLKEDIISSRLLFKVYTRIFYSDEISRIPAGNFTFEKGSSYKEVMDVLINKSTHETITVTIPEGYELREIAELIENKGLCSKEDFLSAADNYDFDFKYMSEIKNKKNRLEGFLFPDTYVFAKDNTDAVTVIQTMLKRFEEVYSEYENVKTDYSIYETVTLASIIEREAMYKEDFFNVSSVFHNRLKRDDYLSYLQSCATVQYILKERKTVLSVSDTKIDSPYNTYKYPGLPEGPISSPGKLAIDAALNPNKTDYLYFLNDKDGRLHFSKTLSEHEKLKNKYVN